MGVDGPLSSSPHEVVARDEVARGTALGERIAVLHKCNDAAQARNLNPRPESFAKQRECQALGATHHALHLTIANFDWLIADC